MRIENNNNYNDNDNKNEITNSYDFTRVKTVESKWRKKYNPCH